MNTKTRQTFRSMDSAKLQAEVTKTRQELARTKLDMSMGKVKDSNAIAKNKRKLAVLLTFLREAREA